MAEAGGAARPTILILGGYGNFGLRAARRLARSGACDVIIAGRDETRARAAAEQLARGAEGRITHARLDASAPDRDQLARLAPRVVINASGPFQAQGYELQRLCIALGIHCVDLADSRAYVTGIDVLDASARAQDVLVVSGASTVPGLSAAVLDHFAPEFARIEAIDYGITPGNRTEQGVATVRSVLSYLGRPFAALRARTSVTVHGWQDVGRERYPELGPRWMAACDVPDLDLFPRRYAGLASIRFRAGAELGLAHLGLWLLSWPARAGLVRRPERLAGLLHGLRRGLGAFGSDRGGMHVKLWGVGRDGRPLHRAWYLVARSGHGPEIPALASVLVARKLATGLIGERGARACTGLFTLAELLAEASDLDVTTHTIDRSPYLRAARPAADALPAGLVRLHEPAGERIAQGRGDVAPARNPLLRLLARVMALPRPGRDQRLTMLFKPDGLGEEWVRAFAGGSFRSRLWHEGGMLYEQVGPARFAFRLVATADGARLDLHETRLLGVPLPRVLAPRIASFDAEGADGRYRFAVEARVPLLGRVVRYTGTLEPTD